MELIQSNENQRIKSLYSYRILDTPTDPDFETSTSLAADICECPVAYISFIDSNRQWFKSCYGIVLEDVKRENAICSRTILKEDGYLIIPDLSLDETHDLPEEVKNNGMLKFYAGFNVTDKKGLVIGTICVMSPGVNQLNSLQIRMMQSLARQVSNLLEVGKKHNEALEKQKDLAEKNRELEQFAYVVSHDIRSPLNSIFSLTQLLERKYASLLDARGQKTIGYINNSAEQLQELVSGILAYYRGEELIKQESELTDLEGLIEDVTRLLNQDGSIEFKFRNLEQNILVNNVALKQIIMNLITNADKYNDKDVCQIELGYASSDTHHQFYVEDNGPGIEPSNIKTIFKAFTTLNHTDKYGKKGTGIGLATVKKLVTELGGKIKAKNAKKSGLRIDFSLKK